MTVVRSGGLMRLSKEHSTCLRLSKAVLTHNGVNQLKTGSDCVNVLQLKGNTTDGTLAMHAPLPMKIG